MTQNGLQQIELPWIAMFCDRIMSEPLHLEINIRQHILDVLNKVAVVDSLSNS